eukprot:1141273-Pelagomonas_calceolata.AAC.3
MHNTMRFARAGMLLFLLLIHITIAPMSHESWLGSSKTKQYRCNLLRTLPPDCYGPGTQHTHTHAYTYIHVCTASHHRAVDRLHDLLLPPFLTTTAPEHTTNLTATSPASSRPSSAAAPLRRIGDTGRDQQQHQGQYQAQQFKMKHAAHAPNFNSHEGLTALQSSSPAHSMPASPRARPASPKARPASAQAALHLNPK